jgi:cell division septation protein DedD
MTHLRVAASVLLRAVRVAACASVVCASLAITAPGSAQGTDTTHAAPPAAAPPAGSPAAPAPGAASADATPPARDTAMVMGPADSAIQRAQTLVAQGHTEQGRALVDSVLATTPPGSGAYASALYARASLATNADSAEDDYRRITVDYATSPRASDALLRLAQLELARGDRVQAADHLARLTREQLSGQSGITYARTELQVGLAYFDLQDLAHACAALVGARAAAPTTDVELRNRIDYNVQRCPRAALEPPGAAPAASMSPPPAAAAAIARDSAHRAAGRAARSKADSATSPAAPAHAATPAAKRPKASVPPAASPSPAAPAAAPSPSPTTSGARHLAPAFTVQVAAYPTRAAAESLAAHLRERGYQSRVFGGAAPFRVRVGRYATEAAADTVERALKAKGMEGFVTGAEPVTP